MLMSAYADVSLGCLHKYGQRPGLGSTLSWGFVGSRCFRVLFYSHVLGFCTLPFYIVMPTQGF